MDWTLLEVPGEKSAMKREKIGRKMLAILLFANIFL